MERMIALKKFKYPASGGTKLQPGDEFMAHAKDVRVLGEILGKAKLAPKSGHPVVASQKALQAEQPSEPKPREARQAYRHRAMSTENSAALVPPVEQTQAEPAPEPVEQPASAEPVDVRAQQMTEELGQMSKRALLDIAIDEQVVHSASDRVPELIDKIVKHRMTKEQQ